MSHYPGRTRRRHGFALGLVAALFAQIVATSGAAAGGLVGTRAAHVADQSGGLSVAEVRAAHADGTTEATKLTLDLSKTITPTVFTLANPDRLIVDLPQVGFALDPSVGRPQGGRRRKPKTLIDSFRFGLLAPGRSRIVVDLAAPARIASAAVEPSTDGFKLVVSLGRTDRVSFNAAAHRQSVAQTPSNASAMASTPSKPTIVLDPGHGGPDTGAIVNGVIEKDVALAFVKELAGKLESIGRFNVVMTRTSDIFIPLSDRVDIARKAGAALMVSVHADTLPETTDVSGATVYTVSDKASDAYAAKVAAKENDADTAAGVDGQADTADVNDILFDLTRQETRAYSHVFARTLVNYWKVAGRLNKNPQRAAGFVVLKAPDVPSVLLELGYLSSPADSAALVSEAWRDRATGRMAQAIESYFADGHGSATTAAAVLPLPVKQANAEPK